MSWRALYNRLEEPLDVKRIVYRGHRLAGLALFAGALFALDRLTLGYEAAAFERALRGLGSRELLAMLLESLRVFLVAGNAVALVAGLVVAFRPSVLKGVERWADRGYGTRNTS